MAVLGYLQKLKRGLGPVFGAHFVYDFFIKMLLIEYSIYGQSFIDIAFSFSRFQTKCVDNSYLDNW